MSERLFRKAECGILPERGAFTAAEVVEECIEYARFAVERWERNRHLIAEFKRLGDTERLAQVPDTCQSEAVSAVEDLDAHLALVSPFLDMIHSGERVLVLSDWRDKLMEVARPTPH